MMTFREFVEYLEELSKAVRDSAFDKSMKEINTNAKIKDDVETRYGKWYKSSRDVIGDLDKRIQKRIGLVHKIIDKSGKKSGN